MEMTHADYIYLLDILIEQLKREYKDSIEKDNLKITIKRYVRTHVNNYVMRDLYITNIDKI